MKNLDKDNMKSRELIADIGIFHGGAIGLCDYKWIWGGRRGKSKFKPTF